jgi:hypothetical protein
VSGGYVENPATAAMLPRLQATLARGNLLHGMTVHAAAEDLDLAVGEAGLDGASPAFYRQPEVEAGTAGGRSAP